MVEPEPVEDPLPLPEAPVPDVLLPDPVESFAPALPDLERVPRFEELPELPELEPFTLEPLPEELLPEFVLPAEPLPEPLAAPEP